MSELRNVGRYNWIGVGTALLLSVGSGLSLGFGEQERGSGGSPLDHDTGASRLHQAGVRTAFSSTNARLAAAFGAVGVREQNATSEVQDAGGRWIPVQGYLRIVSGSSISDALLLEFVEPSRIASFTRYSQDDEERKHQYADKPHLNPLEELEQTLELRPDLVLVSTDNNPAKVKRLEQAGIRVFDLGPSRGVDTFLRSVRAISLLVDRPRLGEQYAKAFLGRLRRTAVEAKGPQAEYKSGMYLSMFGSQLYTGGRHTSYDDVLHYSGIRNVVDLDGWPQLNAEQVITWDPDVLVTQRGMRTKICRSAGLELLRACRTHAVVELSPAVLADAGAGMLRAAERIYVAVYGRPRDKPSGE